LIAASKHALVEGPRRESGEPRQSLGQPPWQCPAHRVRAAAISDDTRPGFKSLLSLRLLGQYNPRCVAVGGRYSIGRVGGRITARFPEYPAGVKKCPARVSVSSSHSAEEEPHSDHEQDHGDPPPHSTGASQFRTIAELFLKKAIIVELLRFAWQR